MPHIIYIYIISSVSYDGLFLMRGWIVYLEKARYNNTIPIFGVVFCPSKSMLYTIMRGTNMNARGIVPCKPFVIMDWDLIFVQVVLMPSKMSTKSYSIYKFCCRYIYIYIYRKAQEACGKLAIQCRRASEDSIDQFNMLA